MYHYTYEISTTAPTDERRRYIGVRSSVEHPMEDVYFGSCSSFKSWQRANGVTSLVKKVFAIFQTRAEAMLHEIKLHELYAVDASKEFFNKSKATSKRFFYARTGDSNSFYGKKHTDKTKQLIRNNVLNNPNHICRRKGVLNHNYGKTHSDATKAVWSEQRKGSHNGRSKLTEDSVMKIKKLLEQGEYTQTAIGALYNVSKQTINHISKGYRWSHITLEETA